MEFMGKNDRALIKAVNTALGMKHRSKPYDLKNIDDLVEATKMITGELLDTWQCYSLINTACEIYDEAMEHYHTAAWADPDSHGDSIYVDAHERIEELEDTMCSILMDLEDECRTLWEAVLNNAGCSQYFFNEVIDISGTDMEAVFERVFEQLHDMEYDTVIDTSVRSFAKTLIEILK
jgi:hypothetical protein